jgi:ribonuclease T2
VAQRTNTPYTLSLSWSPAYCADTRHDRDAECRQSRGFIVHGLWPKHDDENSGACDHDTRVSDDTLKRMLPIMGSRGLVIHEWRKHGACSGLDPDAYFARMATASQRIRIPPHYAQPPGPFTTTVNSLRADFTTANPAVSADDVTPVCRNGALQEVRVCLDGDLNPASCGRPRQSCSGSFVVQAAQ